MTRSDSDPDSLVDLYFEDSDTRPSRRRGATERSTGQLCREVERTVTLALAAAEDERLLDLVVVAVDPAPDASRLQVMLLAPGARTREQLDELEACLDRARGERRGEVARSLQRKRTPELRFVIESER